MFFSQSKQNNNFIKAVVYILSTKKYYIRNGAKWNLRKDYEKSKLLQLKFF